MAICCLPRCTCCLQAELASKADALQEMQAQLKEAQVGRGNQGQRGGASSSSSSEAGACGSWAWVVRPGAQP